jgi:D-alanyl-lipoteichoic acid acyltransferase DltB (MBOAT superfamily)
MVFDSKEHLPAFAAWVGAFCYAFQIYWDFSGYTDMALGAALLFNVRLPVNFDSPYKAGSLTDFWNHWHITLSRWLRQYLYIPLGGNRSGPATTLRNVVVVMLLGGLWHGAAWTFVLWGLLHGSGLAIHRLWAQLKTPLPAALAVAVTFLFVVIAWVPFRAETFADAWRVWSDMAAASSIGFSPTQLGEALNATNVLYLKSSASAYEAIPWLIVGTVLTFAAPNSLQLGGLTKSNGTPFNYNPASVLQPVVIGLTLFLTVLLMLLTRSTEFIYFNF